MQQSMFSCLFQFLMVFQSPTPGEESLNVNGYPLNGLVSNTQHFPLTSKIVEHYVKVPIEKEYFCHSGQVTSQCGYYAWWTVLVAQKIHTTQTCGIGLRKTYF